MDISKGSIYELLNGKYQFVVPVYQRKYSWLKDVQCDRLWKDIVNMEKTVKATPFCRFYCYDIRCKCPDGNTQIPNN